MRAKRCPITKAKNTESKVVKNPLFQTKTWIGKWDKEKRKEEKVIAANSFNLPSPRASLACPRI